MSARPCFALFAACSSALIALASLAPAAGAQQAPSALPDAPHPAIAVALPPAPASQPSMRPDPIGRLTFRQRFILQARDNFAPFNILLPTAEAGIVMADPPPRYPRDWSDGAEAFGRNYGSELGRHTAAGFTHFAVAAIDREDPRYYPSHSRNYLARTGHALLFTLIDRNDARQRTFALSNILGAAGGGFIGMAWEPDGFNDVTHAYQRSAVEVSGFATHNLRAEFAPELNKLLVKFHLQKILGPLDFDAPPPVGDLPPAQPN